MMGDMVSSLLAVALGAFLFYGAMRALAAEAGRVRRARILGSRGRIADAVIMSLAEPDPEGSTRQAVVRFEVQPGQELKGTTQLRCRPELIPGTVIQVRYDPANPMVLAAEVGRRQRLAAVRWAVVRSAVILMIMLPVSMYLVMAGLRGLPF